MKAFGVDPEDEIHSDYSNLLCGSIHENCCSKKIWGDLMDKWTGHYQLKYQQMYDEYLQLWRFVLGKYEQIIYYANKVK
jgi:hypothetical protein